MSARSQRGSVSFQACQFEYSVERARCEFLSVLAGNGDDELVFGVLKVSMAAPGPHLHPAVLLQQANDFAHLQGHHFHPKSLESRFANIGIDLYRQATRRIKPVLS